MLDGTSARWSADGKYTPLKREVAKMGVWTADFGNGPYDDYNLIVKILCNDEEIAVIKQGKQGLEIKWYPNNDELIVPLDWLLGLLSEAKKRMSVG